MKTKREANKLLSILLLFSLLLTLLSGCGNGEEISENSDGNEQNTQSSEEVTAMGRYVEEAVNLPDEVYRGKLSRLEDGSLVICASYSRCIFQKITE